jgi:7-carboxy-7-deazaguanine synthase
MTTQEVLAAVGRSELVVLTGGEPMMQDLTELVPALLALGRAVQIETAGDHWQDLPYDDITVVCSPKTSELHPALRPDVYKYVVAAGETPVTHGEPVFIQPMDDGDNTKKNVEWCVQLCMERGWRLSLQTHKALGIR